MHIIDRGVAVARVRIPDAGVGADGAGPQEHGVLSDGKPFPRVRLRSRRDHEANAGFPMAASSSASGTAWSSAHRFDLEKLLVAPPFKKLNEYLNGSLNENLAS